jgi:NlpC/P60 family
MRFYKIILSIFLFGFFIICGCSSSSDSVRYNEREEKEEKNDNRVRFTDKNDINPNGKDSASDLSNRFDLDSDENDPDEIPPDSVSIDVNSVFSHLGENDNNSSNGIGSTTPKDKIMMEIVKYLNTPYIYGGNTKNGIDCSGFTRNVFNDALSVNIARTAHDQFSEGEKISRSNLQFGDLIFFNTRRRVKPGHVGIYIGNGLFVHASFKYGVIVSSLSDNYYLQKYMGARRIEDFSSFGSY